MAQPPKPRNRMNAQSKANAEVAKDAVLHRVPNSSNGSNAVTATVIGETGKTAFIVNGAGEPIEYTNPLTAKRALQKYNPGLPVRLAPEI